MGTQDLVLFRGTDANGISGLWETDGTSAGVRGLFMPLSQVALAHDPHCLV